MSQCHTLGSYANDTAQEMISNLGGGGVGLPSIVVRATVQNTSSECATNAF